MNNEILIKLNICNIFQLLNYIAMYGNHSHCWEQYTKNIQRDFTYFWMAKLIASCKSRDNNEYILTNAAIQEKLELHYLGKVNCQKHLLPSNIRSIRIEEFAGLYLNQVVIKNIQKTFVMVPCNVFKVLKYKKRINFYKCRIEHIYCIQQVDFQPQKWY